MEAVNNFGDNIKNQMSNLGDSVKERLSGIGLGTEDPFYMYVAIGAFVILIIVLIALGVMMSELQSTTLFPPTQNACPDYWDLSSNGQCVFPHATDNDRNQGTGVIQTDKTTDPSIYAIKTTSPGFSGDNGWGKQLSVSNGATTYTGSGSQLNYRYVSLSDPSGIAGMAKLYPGLSTRCAQKKWAVNNNIVWDGVSNFNGC
jgi:hypothetical protein